MNVARTTEYVAECLWPGVTEADLAALDARARASASADVHYLSSMLMPNDEVVFCFFDGPSAEAVRAVAERAEIPFERIVESVRASASGNSPTQAEEGARR